jgi:hypothetical protein
MNIVIVCLHVKMDTDGCSVSGLTYNKEQNVLQPSQ